MINAVLLMASLWTLPLRSVQAGSRGDAIQHSGGDGESEACRPGHLLSLHLHQPMWADLTEFHARCRDGRDHATHRAAGRGWGELRPLSTQRPAGGFGWRANPLLLPWGVLWVWEWPDLHPPGDHVLAPPLQPALLLQQEDQARGIASLQPHIPGPGHHALWVEPGSESTNGILP